MCSLTTKRKLNLPSVLMTKSFFMTLKGILPYIYLFVTVIKQYIHGTLVCPKPCNKLFTCMVCFNPHLSFEVDIISIVWMQKWRFRLSNLLRF